MAIKKIELELEFPDDFAPPEKFDESECIGCPLCTYDSGYELAGCAAEGYEECPLKKLFDKKV